MIILKQTIFRKDQSFLEFNEGLSEICDDEDYSGRNGLEFTSDEAIEAGFECDFDFDFKNVISSIQMNNNEPTSEKKEKIIRRMFNKYLEKNINYYGSAKIEITEFEGNLFVSVAMESE